MSCGAKHCKVQVPDDQWKCPKCGVPAHKGQHDGWIIQESDEEADPECGLVHDRDSLGCNVCEHGMTGRAYSAWYVRRANLKPCSHCKGRGFVKG